MKPSLVEEIIFAELIKQKLTDKDIVPLGFNMLINMLENKQYVFENKMGTVSDGYHTFNELYHHRAILFATLCNQNPNLAWKSLQHDDPNQPMYDGMFICGIETCEGYATYHYDIDPYWNMFHVKELERAPKWDGHTPDEAIKRIYLLSNIK